MSTSNPATHNDHLGRDDRSFCLIHFTRGGAHGDAFNTLVKILNDRRLIGSNSHIRSRSSCVCFSEAPMTALRYGLVNDFGAERYSQFGIRFTKKSIFDRGGRPVIYQPESEYQLLPESLKWRHVRFECNNTRPIDFTWEREWRLPDEELPFTPEEVQVIVPTQEYVDRLSSHFDIASQFQYELLGFPGHYDQCPWKLLTLT